MCEHSASIPLASQTHSDPVYMCRAAPLLCSHHDHANTLQIADYNTVRRRTDYSYICSTGTYLRAKLDVLPVSESGESGCQTYSLELQIKASALSFRLPIPIDFSFSVLACTRWCLCMLLLLLNARPQDGIGQTNAVGDVLVLDSWYSDFARTSCSSVYNHVHLHCAWPSEWLGAYWTFVARL